MRNRGEFIPEWLIWPTMIGGFVLNHHVSKFLDVSNEIVWMCVASIIVSFLFWTAIDRGVRLASKRLNSKTRKTAMGYRTSWKNKET